MSERKFFSIGEMGKICGLSVKALRYYDKVGIISPDYINPENGYRYYSKKTLSKVCVLKYYKQLGFKLEEMQGILGGEGYPVLQMKLQQKMDELRIQEEKIRNSFFAVREWNELVQEAQMVIDNQLKNISVKYIGDCSYCYMQQSFEYDYQNMLINMQWNNYLEKHDERIAGAVILAYDSFEEKIKRRCTQTCILQKSVNPNEKSSIQKVEQIGMAVCVYHIGSHETIDEEYDRIKKWAKERGIKYSDKSYERFVVDYWSTEDTELFVTEIIVPIAGKDS